MVDPIRNAFVKAVKVLNTPIELTGNVTDQDRLRAASEGLRAAGSILRDYAKGTSPRGDKKPAMELASKLEQRNPREMMTDPRAYDQLFKGLTAAEVELFKRAEQYVIAQTLGPADGQ